MLLEDQFAAPKMSAVDTPAALAFDEAAPLVECAENIGVSIPA